MVDRPAPPLQPRALRISPGASDGWRAQPAEIVDVGGTALLLDDVRTASLVLNHGRRLATSQLFGLPPEDANVPVAVMLLAQGTRQQVCSIAVPSAREVPGLPALLVIAVLGAAAVPTVGKSLRAMRSRGHQLDAAFHHRYGYLVDPGRRRARRAQRRALEAPTAVPADRRLSP